MSDERYERNPYSHEQRPKSQLPVGVTKLPQVWDDEDGVLYSYLTARGLDPVLAGENGWYLSKHAGDGYLRVVIPCINTKGYVYWQARAIYPDVTRRYQSPSYSSSNSLAIVWPTCNAKAEAAIVEGPMDALAAAECGVAGVATMGKQPTDEQLTHVMTLFRRLYIRVIPDRADVDAGSRVVATLATRFGKHTHLYVPRAKDLAAMTLQERRGFFDFYYS